jgi:hypothetical protein
MKLYQYLTEKTFQLTADANLLYNQAYKDFLKIFKEKDFEKLRTNLNKRYDGKDTTFLSTDSSVLKSKDAQKAHLLNPVKIRLGIYHGGSGYSPEEVSINNMTSITISLNKQVMDIIRQNTISIVPEEQLLRFNNELKPDRIKGTIAHELSHWMNDTLNNKHIANLLIIAKELSDPEILKLKQANVNMTHFELDAQIHALKQIKANNRKLWDTWTLYDVFQIYTSLNSIASSLKNNPVAFDLWQKALIKRMAREKILGKNMRTFVKKDQVK